MLLSLPFQKPKVTSGENSVICVACGTSPGETEMEPPVTGTSYLNKILLFLLSTRDGLLDGFRFSQDSLSFIQFVAALSIRHFLIDSRRQSMGKVKDRAGGGAPQGESRAQSSVPLRRLLSLLCLWNKAQEDPVKLQTSHSAGLQKQHHYWSQGSSECQLLQEAFPDYFPGSSRLR